MIRFLLQGDKGAIFPKYIKYKLQTEKVISNVICFTLSNHVLPISLFTGTMSGSECNKSSPSYIQNENTNAVASESARGTSTIKSNVTLFCCRSHMCLFLLGTVMLALSQILVSLTQFSSMMWVREPDISKWILAELSSRVISGSWIKTALTEMLNII